MSTQTETTSRGWTTFQGEPTPLVRHHIGGTKYERIDIRRYRNYKGVLTHSFNISTMESLSYDLIASVVRDTLKLSENVKVNIHYGGCYGPKRLETHTPHIIEVVFEAKVNKPSLIPSEEMMKHMSPDYEQSRDAIVDALIDQVQLVMDEKKAEEQKQQAKHYRDILANHFRENSKKETDYEERVKALREEVKALAEKKVKEQTADIKEWLSEKVEDPKVQKLTLEMLQDDPHPHGGILGSF